VTGKAAKKPTKNEPTQATADLDAVRLALGVTHSKANEVGRCLHRHEARWLVRYVFRHRFPKLSPAISERYADVTMDAIRRMVERQGR